MKKMSFRTVCFSIIVLMTFIPVVALGNGAAGMDGVSGSDIFVKDEQVVKGLIVNEEVTIDFKGENVKTIYFIKNKSEKTINFEMIFPIEGECNNHSKGVLSEAFDTVVYLNGERIESHKVSKNEIEFEGEYTKLKSDACAFTKFNVTLQQGENELVIMYDFWPDYMTADGFGTRTSFYYSIWPAKNWVSQFGIAKWRIIIDPPSNHSVNNNIESYERVNINAPGKRYDYPDYIEFVAENFTPDGYVIINKESVCLYARVSERCRADYGIFEYDNCTVNEIVSLRPYEGDSRCYGEDDLRTEMSRFFFIFDPDDLKYLRNEIFARKGYKFKSQAMKRFFSRIPWYEPQYDSVELNKYEKRNVQYLKQIEEHIEKIGPKDDYWWYEANFPDFIEEISFSEDAVCPE